MGSVVRSVVVAVVMTVAAALPGAPASASTTACAPGHGVTVVVEPNQLGGDDVRLCDEAGGGRTAARLLEGNGVPLSYVQRQPGFVCRVAGRPAEDPCVNTPPDDAYWSLWWSDGSGDTWSYATTGVDTLQIPDGGSVALAWDGDPGDVMPTTPPGAAATTTPHTDSADSGPITGRVHRDDGGLPAWVAPSVLGMLVAAAAGTAVVRRRRGTRAP